MFACFVLFCVWLTQVLFLFFLVLRVFFIFFTLNFLFGFPEKMEEKGKAENGGVRVEWNKKNGGVASQMC